MSSGVGTPDRITLASTSAVVVVGAKLVAVGVVVVAGTFPGNFSWKRLFPKETISIFRSLVQSKA